jgi:glycosyltransferase involved in cell wall biosynthesis
MSGILVSVIIPCYNLSRFLGEAIESVLNQSYRNCEIIVVDDGSIDDTASVATQYPSVNLVRQSNRGFSAARNAGIERSSGDLLVFLDADDRLLPNAIEDGVECLEHNPHCAFVYGRYRLIKEDGSPLSAQIRLARDGDYLEMLRFNYIGMLATVMYRRAVLEAVKGFDTSVAACEDYDLYLRITRLHSIISQGNVVAEYRQHQSNISSDPELMLRSSLMVLRRQWRFVRGNKAAREAYHQGVRNWQDYYGTKLIRTILKRIKARAWKQVLRGVFILLRYYPIGVALKVLKKARSIAALGPRLFSLKASR